MHHLLFALSFIACLSINSLAMESCENGERDEKAATEAAGAHEPLVHALVLDSKMQCDYVRNMYREQNDGLSNIDLSSTIERSVNHARAAIDAGANINSIIDPEQVESSSLSCHSKRNTTFLDFAIESGCSTEIIKLLLDKGASTKTTLLSWYNTFGCQVVRDVQKTYPDDPGFSHRTQQGFNILSTVLEKLGPDHKEHKQTILTLLFTQCHSNFLNSFKSCADDTRDLIVWHKQYVHSLITLLLSHGADATNIDQYETQRIKYWSVTELLIKHGMRCSVACWPNNTLGQKKKKELMANLLLKYTNNNHLGLYLPTALITIIGDYLVDSADCLSMDVCYLRDQVLLATDKFQDESHSAGGEGRS